MASGHANRANRPNTWLHRPMLLREVLTCQPGAVHTWHLAEVNCLRVKGPLWRTKRTSASGAQMSPNDPPQTSILRPLTSVGTLSSARQALRCALAS